MVLTPKTPNLQDHFLLGSQIHRYLYVPCRGQGSKCMVIPPFGASELAVQLRENRDLQLVHIPNFKWVIYSTSTMRASRSNVQRPCLVLSYYKKYLNYFLKFNVRPSLRFKTRNFYFCCLGYGAFHTRKNFISRTNNRKRNLAKA